jgi:hypothetical protein
MVGLSHQNKRLLRYSEPLDLLTFVYTSQVYWLNDKRIERRSNFLFETHLISLFFRRRLFLLIAARL